MDKSLKLPSQPGTYCLVFSCSISLPVTIGKLVQLAESNPPDFYKNFRD